SGWQQSLLRVSGSSQQTFTRVSSRSLLYLPSEVCRRLPERASSSYSRGKPSSMLDSLLWFSGALYE
ncbi:hypothetical protein HispidOSU_023881, partial [Sigmodon hispidus]